MTVNGVPNGWHSITARIVVRDVGRQVQFLKRAFGATGDFEADRPAVIRIGDSNVMISGPGPRAETHAFLYLYLEDADDAYRRAIEAGAKSLEEPADMPYGDRRAMIEDPCGNVWQIATFRG